MTKRLCLIFFFSLSLSNTFGQLQFELLGNSDAIVLDMRIDESKKYLIALTDSDIQQWDFVSNTLLRSWPAESIRSIDLNNHFLAGISKTGQLFIWDTERQTEMRYTVAATSLSCLAWIDSEWILIGSDDGNIYKVSSKTGEIRARASLGEPVTAVSKGFGNSALVGSAKGELGIYDVTDLGRKYWIKAHKTWIREIHLVDSTDFFVTISDDNYLKRWRSSDLSNTELRFPGSWSITSDYFLGKQKSNSVTVVGKLNGKIIVNTGFASYSSKANAIVNKISIVRSELPNIKIIVATHGGGIQIWSGNKMKFKVM